ncbi:MAG: DUF3618 domain-containing protein [Lysobacter sp.]|nr:DUF3618 domain-containing protein [Lysobacter sp.]MDQ3270071.1 DUF3618 domain-containing protein [Pseudomonadota bacterium]
MSTETNNIRIQSQKDPAQLEHEIDQQRDHISELVDALGSKLSPGEIFERALGYGKGGGREFASNLGETIKANPVPAVLTAAGMLWLYAGTRDGAGTTTAGTTTNAGLGSTATIGSGQDKPRMGERVQHMREGVSEKARNVGRSAHDAVGTAKVKAQSGAHRASEGFQHMLHDNPMTLGAMAVVAGALIGSMLPVTRKEHKLMGETSDKLTERARGKARSGLDAASEVGREVKDAARSGDGGRDTESSSRYATQSGQGRPSQGI